MKTTLFYGENAYAVIQTDQVSLDVLLDRNLTVPDSLRKSVREIRKKAERNLRRADLIESAIPMFEDRP